jgi:hypothetical protein
MSKVNCVARICFLLLVTFASAPRSSSQATSQGHTLTLPADKDSVVRFFYQPDHNNYFHVALLFRVVDENDPRRNTAPVFDVGRTAYISISEMRKLLTALSAASLSWEESTTVEGLETYKTIHSYRGMGVKILSSKGTAKATIQADKICETLAPLDGALRTPRALWEFQLYRLQYDCRVPSFDPKAYPDRMP